MARPIDRTTVDRLVVKHLPQALRFARRLTGDPHAAEDVVQEALCLVLKRWRSFRGEASFSTWMMQIILNVDRDRRRRQRKTVPLVPDEIASTQSHPPEEAVAEELHIRIRQAIDRLPDRQREVAILTLGEGLSAKQVADVLQTTEANVHTCLCLARKRIAQVLGIVVSGRDGS